jgi:hypothetical protein
MLARLSVFEVFLIGVGNRLCSSCVVGLGVKMFSTATYSLPVDRDLENDLAALQPAADLLRKGDCVAFPTETVYGLGASMSLSVFPSLFLSSRSHHIVFVRCV